MSTLTVQRHVNTTCTVTTDDGTELVVTDLVISDEDAVEVFTTKRGDGGHNIAVMVQDHDGRGCWHPIDDDEGVTFDSFRRGDPDRFDGDADAVNAYLTADPEHRFLVECYEHGLVSYSLVADGRFYPDRQWDVGIAGILTVPDDVTDPREYARGVLAQYTDWCNGSIYGVIVAVVDPEGNRIESTDVAGWGYIGYDLAEKVARESAEHGVLWE